MGPNFMKTLSIALGVLLTAVGASAAAEDNDTNYPYDPREVAREQAREVYRNNYGYAGEERYSRDGWRDERAWTNKRECWNPRARHFEGVREGERQDDLDFSRCRIVSDNYHRRYR